ncbi:stage III sporulation protein AE [Tenuibacillus multivorans]|uniref:Stage III sporulation protein AE n=1 Tax=Tenuibacillus multivorans TaxID=237069 RepID=A0A1G9Z7I7_9BACI|nr:stage III sporulation protein AE [Tenuibacillus multivorans]GEL77364.1 stage III sporulation protein AE [Tenuibacillus multivorans]SDN17352.1 stage III sporulation protein AE [Tenuibacillus multivorans]
MLKKIFISIIFFSILLNLNFIESNATTNDQLFEAPKEWVESEEMQAQWQQILSRYREYLPVSSDDHWLDSVRDGSIFSLKNWISGIMNFFIDEWIVNGKLLGMLIFLTLLSVFLKLLIGSFENESVSKVSYLVIFGVLLTIAITSFQQAVSYTTGAIDGMGNFMLALLPLMLSMMAAFGNVASVAFFHPLLLVFVQVSGVLISKIVLPLFFLSAILNIASTINKEYNVSQLANLMKHAAFVILGIFLTLFLSVMSLQGVNAAVADGVAIRAAKFVTSNFIPVIGRMFTDATDTVFSASVLLKNSIGLAGVVLVMIITLFPALKVLVLGLIFRLSSALLQPVADGPIVDAIETMGKHILYILAALLAVSMMFFFALVMLIIVGNMTLMVR